MPRFAFAAFPGGLGGFAIGMLVAVGIGYLVDYVMEMSNQRDAAAEPAQAAPQRRGVTVLKRPPAGYRPSPCSEDDPNPCVVCSEATADTTLYPCGHLHLCWTCFGRLERMVCPFCREKIDIVAFNYK
eukprot:TRINITY_DN8219_c0_g1_i1.p2 TRINITY_DN8219_c0_g1~~TRINITY_DN8219_c0_g1_i1.p2  ORF type:complete len:146 (+),score=48.45 TRINITY_DN8219_c0_g1_i1:55-438(+)